jgi:hypothetical protein
MKKRLPRVCLCAMTMLVSFAMLPVNADNIDLQALTLETQKMSQKPDEMTMVWWIPEEFWAASFAQTPDMTASQIEEFLKVIRRYTILVVVDGTMGAFAGVTYKSEDVIRATTRLLDAQGKSYAPKANEEIDADTTNMLQMIKPVFVNMLGPMGQNMHFLLFPGSDETGTPIANAKGKGRLNVKVGDREFTWRLPLDALLPPQVCGNCKQDCKGSWFFCPWCGTKITKSSGS